MSDPVLHFLNDNLEPVLEERPSDLHPWFFRYFAELQDPAGRRRYARALQADLRLAAFDPRGQVILDAGSGFGVTLLCFAALSPALACGIEAFRPMAASSEILRRRCAPDLPAAVFRGSVHRTPFRDASVDFIYCNEAYSHFRDPDAFLVESARILTPGGRLMICDGNNGTNARTVRHVHEIWRRFEQGPPGDDVHGHRIETPYRERRKAMIAETVGALDDTTLERLAWGTFRRHGTDIIDEARRLLESGRLPDRPPIVDVSPVDPVKGDFIENLLHPAEIAARLRALGFRVRVHAHFAGARGPLWATANTILRALTPLTLRYARSVKIVATRLP